MQSPDAPVRPIAILSRHCDPASRTFEILVTHSVLVARKARKIARAWMKREPDVEIDVDFVVEAAMLHDIGIPRCDAPGIACTGSEPYIRHGVIGREILEAEGLPRHALVCERHTGAGISVDEVREGELALPERDFLPESNEEKIVCVADKFFSKTPKKLWREKKSKKVARSLAKWGPAVTARWQELTREVLGKDDD